VRSLVKSFRDTFGPPLYPLIRKAFGPSEAIYRHLPYHGVFTLEVAPGVGVRLCAEGLQVENELFWRGFAQSWERQSLALWRDRVGAARTILDIGANSGIYAICAKALNPAARVIAVEPSAAMAAMLKRNAALNGFAIELLEVAASDHDGEATFYDVVGGHQYSASLEAGMGGTNAYPVPVARIDTLVDGPVDLVKIDVEMHEPAVLRGMRTILERDRPTMIVEVLSDEVRGEIEEALAGLNYRWTEIRDGEHWTNFLLEAETA
jgi:FkbM family methyltransferase